MKVLSGSHLDRTCRSDSWSKPSGVNEIGELYKLRCISGSAGSADLLYYYKARIFKHFIHVCTFVDTDLNIMNTLFLESDIGRLRPGENSIVIFRIHARSTPGLSSIEYATE